MRVRRAGAALVDLALAVALTFALAPTAGVWFAGRSIPMLHVGEPGTLWRGPVPMMLAIGGRLVFGFPFAATLILLAEPLFGGGVGKRLVGLRIAGVSPGARPWRRFLVKASPAWGMTAALVAGSAWLAAAAALAAVVVGIGSLGPLVGRRALHDRAAGTDVAREAPPGVVASP